MASYIKKIAHSSNFGKKRDKKDVIGIVIHYVGSGKKGVETVENNLSYFANNANLEASAHFFVDSKCWGKSVGMNRVAYSVGKDYGHDNISKGIYYGYLTNNNTVSIEICDFYSMPLPENTLKNLIKCIKYILKYCPNVKHIVRHYDVNGKQCPAPVIDAKEWNKLQFQIVKGLING